MRQKLCETLCEFSVIRRVLLGQLSRRTGVRAKLYGRADRSSHSAEAPPPVKLCTLTGTHTLIIRTRLPSKLSTVKLERNQPPSGRTLVLISTGEVPDSSELLSSGLKVRKPIVREGSVRNASRDREFLESNPNCSESRVGNRHYITDDSSFQIDPVAQIFEIQVERLLRLYSQIDPVPRIKEIDQTTINLISRIPTQCWNGRCC